MNSDGISPLSSESDGVLQAGHNGQQGNLLPLLCVRVIRQREGIVPVEHVVNADMNRLRETGLDLQHGAQVATDIGRHPVIVETGVEILFDIPQDRGGEPPTARRHRFHVPRLPGEQAGNAQINLFPRQHAERRWAAYQSCGTPAHPP